MGSRKQRKRRAKRRRSAQEKTRIRGRAKKPSSRASRGLVGKVRDDLTRPDDTKLHRFSARVSDYWQLGLIVATVLTFAFLGIRGLRAPGPEFEVSFYSLNSEGEPEFDASSASEGPWEYETGDSMSLDLFEFSWTKQSIELPLTFAIRNEGKKIAPVTKAVVRILRPEADIEVGEGGRVKADPEGTSVVYERPIEPLYPEEDWTLYPALDRIRIRLDVVVYPVVTLDSEGLPRLLSGTIVTQSASEDLESRTSVFADHIPIEFELWGADGKIGESKTLFVSAPTRLDPLLVDGYIQGQSIDCEPIETLVGTLLGGQPSREVVAHRELVGVNEVVYREFDKASQVVTLNGQVSSAFLDTDKDELIDSDLWVRGSTPECHLLTEQEQMRPWPDVAFIDPSDTPGPEDYTPNIEEPEASDEVGGS